MRFGRERGLQGASPCGSSRFSWFFRDPPRTAPADPNAVVSPADGRVVVVERAHDPYLDREALKISVFMNVFNVHSNRSPVDGEVRKNLASPRELLNASPRKNLRLKTSAPHYGSATPAART